MLIFRKNPNLVIGKVFCDCPRFLDLKITLSDDKSIRIFTDDEGKQELKVVNRPEMITKNRDYITYINAHLYSNDLNLLKTQNAFFHFYSNEHKTALRTIRDLVNHYAVNKVLLWDPYLRSKDLFNTLYYCHLSDVELLGIGSIDSSSKKFYKKKGLDEKSIVQEEREEIGSESNNNFGLDLKFRLQHSSKGFPFHDRFLLFTGSYDVAPVGFSLGSSINSIGKSHCIIQQIQDPQCVIDSFMKLWNELEDESCIVWPIMQRK